MPNPENDVNAYIDNWAHQSGLLKFQPNAMRIGWDFPFVPPDHIHIQSRIKYLSLVFRRIHLLLKTLIFFDIHFGYVRIRQFD